MVLRSLSCGKISPDSNDVFCINLNIKAIEIVITNVGIYVFKKPCFLLKHVNNFGEP